MTLDLASVSSPVAKRNHMYRSLLLALLVVWFSAWLTAGRYAMLDDAHIHLRYADSLVRTHTISYDGIHRSFGTSSPLYVVVLASLRGVFPGSMLPKGLSVAVYLILIAVMLTLVFRRGQSTLATFLTATLTFCLSCPMGIRWLTDGMETPFHVLFAVLLALLADRAMHRRSTSPLQAAGLVLFGFFMTALRVESASLLCLVSLAIFLSHRRKMTLSGRLSLALWSSPLAVGALLAMATIRLALGAFLPDTALAKSGAPSLHPLLDIAHLTVASLSLGIGIASLWILSAVLLLRALAASRMSSFPIPAVVAANAILPLIATLACVRGQMVQGIRYLLWALVFSALWNALQLGRLPAGPGKTLLHRNWVPLGCLALVLSIMFPIECVMVAPALQRRAANFLAMRSTPFALLHNDNIMASDVGFIGYFTGAPICDVEGLIDGRAFAAQTKGVRIQHCATANPDALFLTDFQLHEASPFLDLHHWSVCRTFDFANATSRDRHYLLFPNSVAPTRCPALGGSPSPYLLD